MAKLSGYLGSSLLKWGRQIVLAQAGSNGIVSTTISADATFDETSALVSLVNGGAADRNVSALASCEVVGMFKVFKNTGSTNVLTLKSSAGSTVATVSPGDWAVILHNGTAWTSISASSLTTILATANTWSALQTFSAGLASTGRATTTDGVGSGDAAIVGGNIHCEVVSNTITNTTTETTFAKHTIPANTLKAGTIIRVRASVRVTGNAGADTLVIKVRLNGVTLYATSAAALLANDVAVFDFLIVSRAAPSAASSVHSSGLAIVSVGGTHGVKASCIAPANYATNGALDVDLRGLWSAASASDIAICESFVVDRI